MTGGLINTFMKLVMNLVKDEVKVCSASLFWLNVGCVFQYMQCLPPCPLSPRDSSTN